MEMRPAILGEGKVTALFGEWPSFHDAEVISATCESTDGHVSVTIVLRATLADVTIRFHDCDDVRLDDFGRQNVLFSLEVAATEDLVMITFDSSIGLEGGLRCRQVEAVEVRPRPQKKA